MLTNSNTCLPSETRDDCVRSTHERTHWLARIARAIGVIHTQYTLALHASPVAALQRRNGAQLRELYLAQDAVPPSCPTEHITWPVAADIAQALGAQVADA